jgi:hypothetical protein
MTASTYTCPDCGKDMPAGTQGHHRCLPTEEWKALRYIRLRYLLDTFDRRYPYVDNVTKRIINWAERGWKGEP